MLTPGRRNTKVQRPLGPRTLFIWNKPVMQWGDAGLRASLTLRNRRTRLPMYTRPGQIKCTKLASD